MSEVTETQVRARLDEVKDLIGRHRVALTYLEKEEAELEVTVRVFERFHERPDYSAMLVSQRMPPALSGVVGAKPAHLPTVPEMIVQALEEAQGSGISGLTPRDLLKFIRDRYWPDAPHDSVGPVAWRMWKKEGRLLRQDDRYSLPKDETPAVQPAGASERGEADVTGNPLRFDPSP